MTEILINIDVPDLKRALAFYQEGLGLRLRRRLFAGQVAELQGPGCRLYLLQQPVGTLPFPGADPRTYPRHWTPVHLDLVVADLPAALAQAQAAGATLEGPVRQEVWGSIATLADPFGHGFCLLAFSAAGYDSVDSQIVGFSIAGSLPTVSSES